MGKTTPLAEPAPTLSEQLERQERARLLASAWQKLAEGQLPTAKERRTLDCQDKEQRREIGAQYLKAMPKGEFLKLCDGTSKVCIEWRDEYGFPWPEKDLPVVNVVEILDWYRQQFIHGTAPSSEEDILLKGASKALKDQFVRERIREKQITNQQKSIELEQAKANYVPIGPIVEAHNELAERIRKTRERLVRDFDGEARERIERAFDDLLDDYVRDIDAKFSDGSDADTDD